MSFEGPPPNTFRAAVLGGGHTALVADKRPRLDRSATGLGVVRVPRSEARRSNERGADRHRLHDNKAIVRRKKREYEVDLINLSRGGAMVGGDLKFKLWDRIELILGEFGQVECAVRWIRDDRVGLEFAHETRIECDQSVHDDVLRGVIRNCFPDVQAEIHDEGEQAATPKAVAERGKRHPLIWNGILYHDYDSDVVRLRNISAGGVLIDCSVTLPEDGTVYLELDGTERVPAKVCWSRGGQSGLSFHTPFDLHRLARAAPDVAPPEWSQPDYLQQDEDEASPWADQWGRLTLSELRYTLRG